jgi:hypothetical protein
MDPRPSNPLEKVAIRAELRETDVAAGQLALGTERSEAAEPGHFLGSPIGGKPRKGRGSVEWREEKPKRQMRTWKGDEKRPWTKAGDPLQPLSTRWSPPVVHPVGHFHCTPPHHRIHAKSPFKWRGWGRGKGLSKADFVDSSGFGVLISRFRTFSNEWRRTFEWTRNMALGRRGGK